MGFRIQGQYDKLTPVLDLKEGQFISEKPSHPHYIDGTHARLTSEILSINFYSDLENIPINRGLKKDLLQAYQNYVALHLPDFGEIKTLAVLQELFA